MKLRLDPRCLRIRLSYDEAVRLEKGEVIEEAYDMIGIGLEVRTSPTSELSFEGATSGKAKVDVPMAAWSELLERIGTSSRKKEEFEIRRLFDTPNSGNELVLEVDCFDVKRKNTEGY